MKHSDFKCKACGGNRIIYRQDTDNPYDHYACPCKRTTTETIPLVVPDDYDFDYRTQESTRTFDPTSRNGRLMIAVCKDIIKTIERSE